ncbi:MAG: methylated-DNA--[protein]-cysteine S-methyltransferase, partial [Candidatus Hydrothermarchaeales archaeon]
MTDFQRMVYEKTKEIPRGRVTTYQEVANAIDRPKAWRAVANALNKNPHPIEVPCHRVIRSDMLLGGFSRGAEEKKRLLEEEGVVIEKG